MAKDYTVAQAFLGTEQGTKDPQIIKTKAGDCHKYLVKFEGEEDKGWIQILRKIENGASTPVEKGNVLYGSLSENNWGKYDFRREQRPEGQAAPQGQGRPAASAQSQNTSGVEAKLDYIISLLENRGNFQGDDTPATATSPASAPTDDDAPVDLNELDY